jgi:hypothetical protein
MKYGDLHDFGDLFTAKVAFANTAATAAGSGDATEVNGDAIDRFAFTSGRMAHATLVVAARATMASGETLTIAANFQDAVSSTGPWADFGDALAATTTVSAAGGAVTASPGTVELGCDITGARRWVRVQVTPNLSRAGTDTATIAGLVVFGGPEILPAA